MVTATKEKDTKVKDIVTDDEAAEIVLCRPQTLAVWRMLGKGPRYIRVGRLIRYRRADLLAWLERNTVETK